MAHKPFTKADLPPMVEIPDEPMEEMEDGETSPEASDPAGDNSLSPETPPTAEASPEGEGEDPPSPDADSTASANAELAEKAKLWESVQSAYARDPAAYLMSLAQTLDPASRAAVVEKISAATAPPPAPFESNSEGEDWLLQHTQNIAAIPQIIQETDDALRTHAQHLYDQTVEIATLKEQVKALAAIAKIALPELDKKALQQALDGKTSITDAVRRVYTPATEKAVKILNQANKERPNTPGNGASSIPHIGKDVKSMAAIVREITGMGKNK